MGPDVVLFLGAALASGVELVEALTIVLALGTTRGWRAPLLGTAAALAVLAALVAALGPALEAVPLDTLRLVVGALLLVFGLQWLRKAILRAGGRRALHDEDRAYREQVEEARAAGLPAGPLDAYAFVVSCKSVLLEGLEVVFIVLTLGAARGATGLAAAGAGAALVVVLAAGIALRRPLSRVPENTLKLAVGVMLTSFGCFWAGEGVGVEWPGDDAALLALVLATAVWSLVFVRVLRGSARFATEGAG